MEISSFNICLADIHPPLHFPFPCQTHHRHDVIRTLFCRASPKLTRCGLAVASPLMSTEPKARELGPIGMPDHRKNFFFSKKDDTPPCRRMDPRGFFHTHLTLVTLTMIPTLLDWLDMISWSKIGKGVSQSGNPFPSFGWTRPL